jgi:protein-S-isoprenylcysteine O-methyltransferase Ste14
MIIMDVSFRLFLVAYFIIYVSVAFVWRSYRTWKRTGVNPYVLGTSDSAYDHIGLLFRLTFLALLLTVLAYGFFPNVYAYFTPIQWLHHPITASIGVSLLVIACGWTFLAQAQMGAAWRIGIDTTHTTPLIQHGLFRWSRNPIFLGMRITLLGLFCVIPNAATLTILLVGDVLMQIQVRLEEDHLLSVHGRRYQAYMQQTRRWI